MGNAHVGWGDVGVKYGEVGKRHQRENTSYEIKCFVFSYLCLCAVCADARQLDASSSHGLFSDLRGWSDHQYSVS